MSRRFTLRIGDHLDSPDKKRFYNKQLFAEVAPRYDFITCVLSFWRDASWKRDLIAALPLDGKPFCLDLACGTGDLALLLARKYPQGRIVGLDITEPMLAIARARSSDPNLHFVNQDMGFLSFYSKSADIISGGYALRNAPDLGTTMDEINRVLKPGGIGTFLDFSKPVGRFSQHLQYWILKLWSGVWGILLHRNHEVYGYIAESLWRFPDRDTLKRMFQDKGFTIIASQFYFLGITELLVVRRSEREESATSLQGGTDEMADGQIGTVAGLRGMARHMRWPVQWNELMLDFLTRHPLSVANDHAP